jgi:chromosome segregation ATPase
LTGNFATLAGRGRQDIAPRARDGVVSRHNASCDATMAYVRARTTRAGTISTALIEAYRDKQGRPRQRVLNLRGESDPLKALAKLAAQREALRKETKALVAEAEAANRFYEVVTQSVLHGVQYSAEQRKEIDDLMRQRERLLRRFAKVEASLATIEKEGIIIKKHCTASPDEIQAAIRAYKTELKDAEALVFGLELAARNDELKRARAALRRLSGNFDQRKWEREFRQLMATLEKA